MKYIWSKTVYFLLPTYYTAIVFNQEICFLRIFEKLYKTIFPSGKHWVLHVCEVTITNSLFYDIIQLA